MNDGQQSKAVEEVMQAEQRRKQMRMEYLGTVANAQAASIQHLCHGSPDDVQEVLVGMLASFGVNMKVHVELLKRAMDAAYDSQAQMLEGRRKVIIRPQVVL